MQHLEGSGTPVLYIGRTVVKGHEWNFPPIFGRDLPKKGEFIKKYETKYADGCYGNRQEIQNKNDTLISNMNAKTVHNAMF